jgi:hypothetical protein
VASIGRIVALLAGFGMVAVVLSAAVRTVVLPRDEPVLLSRLVFVTVRSLFNLRMRGLRAYEERDRLMARFAPAALLLLPVVWLTLVVLGFTAVYWGLGVDPLRTAFELSGSSLLTLGFVAPPDLPTHIVAFFEGMLGLGLAALLIAYLPSIYAAFQRRELEVSRLATRAGEPPSPTTMIVRHQRLKQVEAIDDLWEPWERWFADVEETHTSQPSLVFFRSISHQRSWLTAAGVVLDSAALRASTLDLPRSPHAELCIRSGYLCLRRIAAYFQISFDADPAPDDPISVDRSEFDIVYDRLAEAGVPVKADRDQCWRDWAGWRVNYDVPLITLAGLAMVPYAEWSSDRSLRYRRPPLTRTRRRRQRHDSAPARRLR